MYIQLQMIKHTNRQFVVLHTCTQILFHTQHIHEMQEIFRHAHNKRQYFICLAETAVSVQISNGKLYYINSSTRHHNKMIFYICVCAVLF